MHGQQNIKNCVVKRAKHLHQYKNAKIKLYTVAQKERIFFSNNCNFFIFNIKKIILTPKQPAINAVLITYIDYSITENYIGRMASFLPYTCPEPLLKLLHHIYQRFMWHSCNFFANGNFQFVDCTRFSNVDF